MVLGDFGPEGVKGVEDGGAEHPGHSSEKEVPEEVRVSHWEAVLEEVVHSDRDGSIQTHQHHWKEAPVKASEPKLVVDLLEGLPSGEGILVLPDVQQEPGFDHVEGGVEEGEEEGEDGAGEEEFGVRILAEVIDSLESLFELFIEHEEETQKDIHGHGEEGSSVQGPIPLSFDHFGDDFLV